MSSQAATPHSEDTAQRPGRFGGPWARQTTERCSSAGHDADAGVGIQLLSARHSRGSHRSRSRHFEHLVLCHHFCAAGRLGANQPDLASLAFRISTGLAERNCSNWLARLLSWMISMQIAPPATIYLSSHGARRAATPPRRQCVRPPRRCSVTKIDGAVRCSNVLAR